MSLYDKASIALIPSGTKAGTLYSVLPANGDGDFTHSRSLTTATRVNKDGLIESVAADVPRLDYPLTNGVVGDCPHLLLEPSRTNVLPYSEEMDNAGWNKSNSTITANQIVSPDGSQTADKYTHGGSTAGNYIFENGFSVSSGTEYTFSVFVKKGTTDFVQILLSSSMFGTLHQNFDINNGIIGSSSGDPEPFIEEYPNDWFRIGITDTATSTGTGSALISLARSNTENRLASFSSSQYFYLWGAQFETGDYKTSYIPTSGSTVTRSVDICGSAGTSAQVNNDAGAFFVEIQALEEGSSASRRITLSAENSDNRILIETDELDGVFKIFIAGGGTVRGVATSYGNTQTDMNKIAVSYDGVNAKAYINGTQAGSITNATTRTGIDTIDIADWNGTSNVYFGRVKQIIVFNEALSDSELETLTS